MNVIDLDRERKLRELKREIENNEYFITPLEELLRRLSNGCPNTEIKK
jgi:hypothetical protein